MSCRRGFNEISLIPTASPLFPRGVSPQPSAAPISEEATAPGSPWPVAGRGRSRSHVWERALCVLLGINSLRVDEEKMAKPFFIFTATQAFKAKAP